MKTSLCLRMTTQMLYTLCACVYTIISKISKSFDIRCMFLRCSNQKSTSLLFLSFSFIALVDLRTSPGPAPAFLLAKYLKIQPYASERATTLPNAWRHNIPQSQRHLGDLSISVRARCLGKQNPVLDTDQLSPTIIITASPSWKPVSGGMPQPSQSDTRGRLPVHSRKKWWRMDLLQWAVLCKAPKPNHRVNAFIWLSKFRRVVSWPPYSRTP